MAKTVIFKHGRVKFLWPGKHGEKDVRVEFSGTAPTHAETLAMLHGKFCAEDRYDKPGQQGRAYLKRWIDEVYQAETDEEVRLILDRCEASISGIPLGFDASAAVEAA